MQTWANNQLALAKADSATLKAIAIQNPIRLRMLFILVVTFLIL